MSGAMAQIVSEAPQAPKPSETLPAPAIAGRAPGSVPSGIPHPDASAHSGTGPAEAQDGQDVLTLADVIASLYRSYPEIERARQEPRRSGGELLQAYGAFDTTLRGYTLSQPTGFYENYRNGIEVARRTWWGGSVATGYRIGRGSFQPWYKERETNEGGEFKLALSVPLLQGRAIDPQRVAIFRATLEQRAAEPRIQQAILDASREAVSLYWTWVATGAVLEAQRELLELAVMRGEQFEAGVEAGRFAEIDLILNQQLIAERRANMLAAEQRYRATAFSLALFLRGPAGQPMVPSDQWLPERFPQIVPPPESNFQEDLAAALARRPEPRLLQIELRQLELERQLATNALLPQVDLIAEASQDVGAPATSARDKGEFELVIGAQGELPIQRRTARGKIESTSARLVQLDQRLRLQSDRIGAELQTAYSNLTLATRLVDQAELALRTAIEALERYRFAFERGRVDLIYLNLLESKVNELEIRLVEAQRGWFAALAEMQAALGLDPLDQALLLSKLPPSQRPGPGHLPEPPPQDPEAFDRDWQRHVNPGGGG